LSFGNSSGSGRGSFERKNVKRKKQNFHTRKVRLNTPANEALEDPESLKNKVMVSLAHLGEQRFSGETGGYTFENWIKSFNLLLDDFEERAGPENLPKEYYDKRLELTSSLLGPERDTSDLDKQISSLRDEEGNLRRMIAQSEAKNRSEHERNERDQKIRELEVENKESQSELDELKKRLAIRRKDTKESRGLFRRFVTGLSKPPDTTPIETLEGRASELDSEIQNKKRRISDLKLRNEKGQLFSSEETVDKNKSVEEMEARLSEIDSEIEKLEISKLDRQQLSEKRKQVTQKLSEIISAINFGKQNSSTTSSGTSETV
jgi:hypothetical protein